MEKIKDTLESIAKIAGVGAAVAEVLLSVIER
jgi:endonuclease III